MACSGEEILAGMGQDRVLGKHFRYPQDMATMCWGVVLGNEKLGERDDFIVNMKD